MTTVSVYEFQQDPLGYLGRVQAGETLRVTRNDRPIAEIRSIAGSSAGLRPYGLCEGEFVVPDDFDAPLPEQTLRDFE
jgi:antitoxin (DNA-binding transcriptional repressor) of toxin-antitoxin stability system